jgi:phage gp29-like protein
MSKILNQYGQPFTTVPLDQMKLTQEIATRNFAYGYFPGFFNFLPDPDPILRNMGKDQTVYKDLLSDDQVGPLFNRRKNLTKSLDWDIEQGDATDKELEICELTIKLLADQRTKMKDIISQSLNPIGFGYSVFEIVWGMIDGKLLPVSLQEKPREWFSFNMNNELVYKSKENYEGIIVVGPSTPPELKYKFILLQNDSSYDNPYGDKALSRCFWPVTFKRGGMRFFGKFVNKYGMPFLFGKLPRNATTEQHLDLLSKLENMVEDAVGTGPDDSSLQIIEANKASSADIYERYINLCNNAISKAILTNALSTDIQKSGARAASETGAETIEGGLSEEDRDFPAELFDQVFKWVVDINIGSGLYPTFKAFEEEDVHKELVDRDAVLTEKFGVKFKKSYITNNYNIPDDEFELEESSADSNQLPPVIPDLIRNPEPLQLQVSKQNILQRFFNWISGKRIELSSNRSQTDNIADQLSNALPDKLLQFQMEEIMKPVFELADSSKSYDEFKKGLAALYPKMNSAQLEDLATKVFLIANLEGKLSVQKEAGRT